MTPEPASRVIVGQLQMLHIEPGDSGCVVLEVGHEVPGFWKCSTAFAAEAARELAAGNNGRRMRFFAIGNRIIGLAES